ncbi:hypothetical protein FRC07_001434 [Ceratobasidium sp. 392]|nr:hypothetical protein FRC07_001434 [Ceratobasidium sp. 392]
MSSTAANPNFYDENPILVAEYKDRKVAIPRSQSYDDIISSIKLGFKTLRSSPASAIELCAKLEGYYDFVCITREVWERILPRLREVKVSLEESEENSASGNKEEQITVEVYIQGLEKTYSVIVSPDYTVEHFKQMIYERESICMDGYRLTLDGALVPGSRKLRECDHYTNLSFAFFKSQKGGKPVIYLFPPVLMTDICVDLALVKSWDFSALYPPTSVSTSRCGALGQAISWTVNAKPDGTLFDHRTQREVAYLFWEAHTNPVAPLSPACSRPGSPVDQSMLAFDPARPQLTPANSVLLPFNKVAAYIDDALISLGLHTEARTSFITYWLPDLQSHENIALRFLPQREYEASAPMSVTPKPDITTRVFMLFGGVKQTELETWADACGRFAKHPSMWRDIVGMDIEKTSDASLFRVLEWGGMEIK